MKRIINPCMSKAYHNNGSAFMTNAYVKITYEEGKLSLVGVVGPRSGGNCYGSAGQCVDEIRNGEPTEDWTKEMLEKLCDIWDEWHLNDMRPYCEHQKELGWRKLASETITLYHYKLKREVSEQKDQIERQALEALRNGKIFIATDEQIVYVNLKNFLDAYNEIKEGSELAKYYEPYKSCLGTPAEEIKTRGWVTYGEESDKGLLCKPCPVCGYKYGTSWLKEEVPQEVIDWLFALPKTKTIPAWI